MEAMRSIRRQKLIQALIAGGEQLEKVRTCAVLCTCLCGWCCACRVVSGAANNCEELSAFHPLLLCARAGG